MSLLLPQGDFFLGMARLGKDRAGACDLVIGDFQKRRQLTRDKTLAIFHRSDRDVVAIGYTTFP